MKKQGIAVAAAVLAMSFGASSAKAQGAAGVGGDQSPRSTGASQSTSLKKWVMRDKGDDDKSATAKVKTAKATNTDKKAASDKAKAAKAETMNTTKPESAHTRPSLNPVKWIKKDKNGANDKPTAPKVKTAKATNADKKAASVKPASAKAEPMNPTKADSTHTHHSLNPVKWIKKAPEKSAQKPDKTKDKKSAPPATPTAQAETPGA